MAYTIKEDADGTAPLVEGELKRVGVYKNGKRIHSFEDRQLAQNWIDHHKRRKRQAISRAWFG